jgi:hypothetical protein
MNGAGDVLPPPSTTPQVNGDWVLFHPVYSPEELKAVEVSHGAAARLPNCHIFFAYRFYIETRRGSLTSLRMDWLNCPGKHRNARCDLRES